MQPTDDLRFVRLRLRERPVPEMWQTETAKATVDALVERSLPRDQARLMEQTNGVGHGWMAVHRTKPCTLSLTLLITAWV